MVRREAETIGTVTSWRMGTNLTDAKTQSDYGVKLNMCVVSMYVVSM